MASQIAGRKADATERNRSMDLAVWLYDKGILSSGAAKLFGIPETVLMYRMGYLGEGPTFDLPPHEWAHDVVTTLRLAINDISNTVINRDPEIMGGTPVFMGTRVTVSTLIDHMLDGYTLDYFLDHFHSVSREQAVRLLALATVILTLTAYTEPEPHKARRQKEHPAGSAGSVIHIDPEIMSGAPVFMGTRVPLSILIDNLSGGYTLNYFVDNYPSVSREQAEQFLELVRETLAAKED